MMESRLRPWAGWALAGYWVSLFISTHTPLPALKDLPAGSDKWMHFVAYAGLQFLLLFWLWTRSEFAARHWVIAVAITSTYAVVDECLQPFVNRYADVMDCVADWIGVVLGTMVFAGIWWWSLRRDAASQSEHE